MRRRQRRLTAERWRVLVEGQRSSGLSVEVFCRRHRLAVSTFFAWRRRLEGEGRPTFVEVTAATDGVASVMAGVEPIEVRLSSGVSPGVVVRVPIGFDPATLRRVVEVLQ